jgi:2-polyprenyl-6-methoxyphenol hydroxylase-like FAD-dependent oxidoreductase
MTHDIKRVCVVGAGLAGLACALAASARGVHVELFDEAGALSALPAHVEVVPSMLRDLVRLGVGDDCVREGFAYSGIDIIDRQGQRLDQLPTQRLAGPRYPAAIGIGHGMLHQILERAALAHGVSLHRSAEVVAVESRGDGASLRLASGEAVATDFVLLAVGASSPLRAMVFPGASAADPVGQVWWYTLARRPVDLDRPCVAIGAEGRKVVLVPVRADTAGLVLVEPSSDVPSALPDKVAAHLREVISAFPQRVRGLLSQLGDDMPFAMRPARAGLLPAPWHRDCVIAVGDCAHALPPHFGQAAAQAIEDAVVFGDLLGRAADRCALGAMFGERRIPRARRVHELTTKAARWDLHPESATDLRELMQSLAQTVAQPA